LEGSGDVFKPFATNVQTVCDVTSCPLFLRSYRDPGYFGKGLTFFCFHGIYINKNLVRIPELTAQQVSPTGNARMKPSVAQP
jgi:hypothetical protein